MEQSQGLLLIEGKAGSSLLLDTAPLSKDLRMGCCKGRKIGNDVCAAKREFSAKHRILNCLDQVYLSHFNPKFTPGPRNHWCYPTCYYELYTSSMLKWKPKAPDNVLTSAKVAPILSEIICTTGFLSSLCQLFAHQCCLCLHCDNLTDTQISSKKVLSIYSLPVVLMWHYLGSLPGVKGGKEGWMPWLITTCYQAFLL